MVASWCERMAGHVFESKHLDFWDVEDGQLVKIWFTRLKHLLESINSGFGFYKPRKRPFKIDFLENDEIPATLIPILKQVTADMEQNLFNTLKQVEDFLAKNPEGGKLPKPITKVQLEI